MYRSTSFFIVCSLVVASMSFAFQPQDEAKPPQTEDPLVIPLIDDDAVSRRDFMRSKLMYSQNIFEGLTTGDFRQIKNNVEQLRAVTAGAAWVTIDNDQYRKLTDEFNTTTKRLMEAAETGNIDAMALRYYQMSTSCIDCHKHIRKAGYEF